MVQDRRRRERVESELNAILEHARQFKLVHVSYKGV
jgi:hypothetical protein